MTTFTGTPAHERGVSAAQIVETDAGRPGGRDQPLEAPGEVIGVHRLAVLPRADVAGVGPAWSPRQAVGCLRGAPGPQHGERERVQIDDPAGRRGLPADL